MTPYVADPDFTLYLGDVRQVLAALPAGSVDCCVTSPPYWGLRDYGVPGQIGLEQTPGEFVAALVAVFREVRRVLADTGSLWLNLGDSYNNRSVSRQSSHQGGLGFESDDLAKSWSELTTEGRTRLSIEDGDLKEKDLIGVPWMVALALRADGWFLRSDIVWSKPNPMPESVTDRPTKSHEYVFLLTKSPRYFFDQDAVREPAEWNRWGDQTNGKHHGSASAAGWIKPKTRDELNANRSSYRPGQTTGNTPEGHQKKSDAGLPVNPAGRNVRSVWEIATQPYSEAHFATFPEELPRRCIKAGCPEGGVVLDPFMGSGTTALVARRLGRRSIGVELNPDYAALAARRLSQLSLLAEGAA